MWTQRTHFFRKCLQQRTQSHIITPGFWKSEMSRLKPAPFPSPPPPPWQHPNPPAFLPLSSSMPPAISFKHENNRQSIPLALRLQQILLLHILLCPQSLVYQIKDWVLHEEHERNCITNPHPIVAFHFGLFKRPQNAACTLNDEPMLWWKDRACPLTIMVPIEVIVHAAEPILSYSMC